MFRLALPAVLVASTLTTGQDREPAAAKLKAFHGVWVAGRDPTKGDILLQSQLVLEFKGDELTFSTQGDGKSGQSYTLKVTGPEAVRFQGGQIEPGRLVLTHGSTRYALYYEFVGDRLVLVGNLPNRPFEGFSLSGDYKRREGSQLK